jgi:hypothetical protein
MRSASTHAGRFHRRTRASMAATVAASLMLGVAAPASAAMMTPTLSSQTTLVQPAGGAGFKFFDTASLSVGGGAPPPTGAVTFKAYGPIPWPFAYNASSCSGAPAYESTDPVAYASATSQIFVPPQGDEQLYLFTATYSGDSNYEAVTSECGAPHESVVVPLVAYALPGTPETTGPPQMPSPPPKAFVPPVRVGDLHFRPSRFALGHGRWALVRFTLTAASPIEITFRRKLVGRRTTRGCVAAARPSDVRTRRRCTAWRTVGAVKRQGGPGANHFIFDGHIEARLLPPGAYLARVKVPGTSGSSGVAIEVVRASTRHGH